MLLLLVLPLVLPLAPAASLLSASPPFAPALQPVLVNFTTRACQANNLGTNFEI